MLYYRCITSALCDQVHKKEKVNKGSLSYKKIQFFETPRGYLTEQRKEMA